SSTVPFEVKASRNAASSCRLTASMNDATGSGIVGSVILSSFLSASGVAAVGEDRLPGDPPALGGEETHDRRDVLDLGELITHALGLVELDALRRLLTVEERGGHRSGGDGGDGDAARSELLRRGTGAVLDRRPAAGIRGVPVGDGREEGGDDSDDLAAVSEVLPGLLDEEVSGLGVDLDVRHQLLAAVSEVLPGLLDEEVSGLGVDVEHRVVLVLGGLDDRLTKHLADSVHGDV